MTLFKHNVFGIGLLFFLFVTILGAEEETVKGLPKNYVVNDGDVESVDIEGNYDFTEEDDVLILTSVNFKHAVYKREYILVEFYAPWCGHCKQLIPEYSEAARQLKADNLTLAKVDATKEATLAKEYMIQAFPTIILFHNGEKAEEYQGERNADGIVRYMKTRTDANWKPPPSAVIELETENFNEFLSKKPLALVLFYATYCKHCHQIKPEFNNAANKLKEYGIPLVQIEGTTHKEIADEFKVRGWPTLFVFRHGRAFEYKGQRDAAGMITYMKEQQKNPTTECKTTLEVKNRIDRYNPTVIGVFKTKSKFYEEFFAVANYLRGEPIKFIHTFSEEIAKSLKVTNEEAIIVKKAPVFLSKYEDDHAVLKNDEITADDMAEFIRGTYRPLVGQRTKQNQVVFYSTRPLIVVYYDANFDHQYQTNSELTRKKVVEVAKEFPDITFAVANEEEYEQELKAAKLDDSGVDVNVIWYGDRRLKYTMEPVDDFDGSDLRTFIHQARDGQLKPVWKSLPIPTKQDGPVQTLVADNFEVEVFKAKVDRDVVFYVYAPWCGHCKEFDKVYKKVAKSISSEKLLFTKLDGSGNDLPPGFEIKGYPTIFFVPAFTKHEPILYDGDRSAKDFKAFVNKHSSIILSQEEKEGRNKVEL
ncbi:unnamed protein product [Orchesella dallaii]|uniref:Protein disulfide-isomerase n=1 Tax=Orchesella dallaii TaxID=48710 RepID=A0ABP1PRU3_9HEXA